jgi:hypothetical protein
MSPKSANRKELEFRRYVLHAFSRDYYGTAQKEQPVPSNSHEKERKPGARCIENHYTQALLPNLGSSLEKWSNFQEVLDLGFLQLTEDEKKRFNTQWLKYSKAAALAKKKASSSHTQLDEFYPFEEGRRQTIADIFNELSSQDSKNEAVQAVMVGYLEKVFPLIRQISDQSILSPLLKNFMVLLSSDASSFWSFRQKQVGLLVGMESTCPFIMGKDSFLCQYFGGISQKEEISRVLLELYQFTKNQRQTQKLTREQFESSCQAAEDDFFRQFNVDALFELYEKVYDFSPKSTEEAVSVPVLEFDQWKNTIPEKITFEMTSDFLGYQESLVAGYQENKGALKNLVTELIEGRIIDGLDNKNAFWVPVAAPYLVSELCKGVELQRTHLGSLISKYLLEEDNLNKNNFSALMQAMRYSYAETVVQNNDQLEGHDCDLIFECLASCSDISSKIAKSEMDQIAAVDPVLNRSQKAYIRKYLETDCKKRLNELLAYWIDEPASSISGLGISLKRFELLHEVSKEQSQGNDTISDELQKFNTSFLPKLQKKVDSFNLLRTKVVYGLIAVGFFIPLLWIPAIIIAIVANKLHAQSNEVLKKWPELNLERKDPSSPIGHSHDRGQQSPSGSEASILIGLTH